MAEAVFIQDGETYVPTENAGGPWDPNALHGGAPAALMARVLEAVDPGHDMFVSRLTVEFMRPVPMAPLRLRTAVIRPGRRVQLLQASLQAGGQEVARATALRIRQLEVDPPAPAATSLPPPPESGAALSDVPWRGFGKVMDPRLVSGSVLEPGPATVWFHLRLPILAGEQPSPLMRAVAAADFGNGISSEVDWSSHIFINPDLTVYLHRSPIGDWIALESTTFLQRNGVGLAQSRLYDRNGPVGTSLQAVLLERRPT
jgi:Thioesterase-like superfamily